MPTDLNAFHYTDYENLSIYILNNKVMCQSDAKHTAHRIIEMSGFTHFQFRKSQILQAVPLIVIKLIIVNIFVPVTWKI